MGFDSILTAADSDVLSRTEFYKQGVTLPDHTVAMRERTYTMGGDDWMVGGMAVLFFVLAYVFYKSRVMLMYRLKDFFAAKRTYMEEQPKGNASEAVHLFLLLTASILSFSLMFLNGLIGQGGAPVVAEAPYWLLGAGFVVILSFVYVKAWLYVLVGWVFFDSESSKRWVAGYLLLTSLTAYLFYPIALVDIFFPWGHEVCSVCAILVVILYEMLLFYKLITNFKVKKYGYLVIILYFCSVELLPMLVLEHWAVWLSDNIIIENLLY